MSIAVTYKTREYKVNVKRLGGRAWYLSYIAY